jgi:hypothetical protein
MKDNDVVRFSKLKNITVKGKISEYEKNWKKAKAAIEKGQVICISDLIGQAEDIHLTDLENTGRGRKRL